MVAASEAPEGIGVTYFGFVLGFVGLEVASILVHKFLFHGPLWRIHRTHHRKLGSGPFELNDLFSLFFAAVGIVLLYAGVRGDDLLLGIGAGISAYGTGYFVVHDLTTHRRFLSLRPRVPTRFFVRRHRRHHQRADKEGQGPWGLFSGL